MAHSPSEVAFTCINSGRISVWDVSSGAVRKNYSGDIDGGGSICLLNRDFLLCALQTIPFIYVWNVRKEQIHFKIACVGLVGAIACTSDGTYCAAGIGEKIHFWEVCTGRLMAVVSQHYQTVDVLRFSDDGVHLISGGADARVLVWKLSSVLSDAFVSSGHKLPHSPLLATSAAHPLLTRHIWSDHSLPVKDIHCGHGGLKARVATVSLDQTCKLYEMSSGSLLCSFLFGFPLNTVAMDLAEFRLFVGGCNGAIAQINLFTQNQKHLATSAGSNEEHQKMCYQGHSKAITALAVSNLGNQLVSSSEDCTIRVWDIASHQTVKTITMKGPVSSMLVCSGVELSHQVGQGLTTHPLPPFQPFRKQLYYSGRREDKTVRVTDTVPMHLHGTDPFCDRSDLNPPYAASPEDHTKENDMATHGLKQELSEMKDIHKRLYRFMMDKLLEENS